MYYERKKRALDDDVLTFPALDEGLLRTVGGEFDDGYRGKGDDRCGESAGQAAHSNLPEASGGTTPNFSYRYE